VAPEKRLIAYQRLASEDVKATFRWYERQRHGLGEEFLSALKDAEDLIASFPLSCPLVHGRIRRVLLRRFPYGVYFRIEDERIVIVACYHGRRDPRGWKNR
jgi:toxin ParE1/3/4